MQRIIDEKESDVRKHITRRVVRLLPDGDARYYEKSGFAWLD